MADWPTRLTPLDRFLSRFTLLRPGEGRSVVYFFAYALLMMFSYYILKTIREPLLLTGSGAEMKSYAHAAIAGVLLLLVPLYGVVFRHAGKQQLTRFVTLFFLFSLGLFWAAGQTGADIGFAYYVWVGIFSLMITAQFWAFAADSFSVKSGQRLFPVIMVGATLGGLLAPFLSGALFPTLGPWLLMLAAMGLLTLTLPLVRPARAAVPPGSRALDTVGGPASGGAFGGITLVLTDRYLFLLALLILLLNWVNTTGEYILAELVVRQAEAFAAGSEGAKGDFIAAFYGNYFFTVNLVTVFVQVFLVARIIRRIGVQGAVLILPLISLAGYGLVAFLPVFSILRVVKILENSTDYSLMNTTRHALYLPLSPAQKYEGKTAIEAFFWRFGDLLQAGAIYAGLNWFQYGIEEFAVFNMMLAAAWLVVAWELSRLYRGKEQAVSAPHPPRLHRPPQPRALPPGEKFDFELPADTFVEPDLGDVLRYKASVAGQRGLPGWLEFDAETLRFRGTVPPGAGPETVLRLRATDFDGAWAETRLVLKHDF
jgi:AAA family ATP:ADP antiporter